MTLHLFEPLPIQDEDFVPAETGNEWPFGCFDGSASDPGPDDEHGTDGNSGEDRKAEDGPDGPYDRTGNEWFCEPDGLLVAA
ncbi:MAG TPA: hypothetical protein VK497_02365 [Candidatus Saccharimonadales bacterium]|nr:hypothetical protein [Candidatus Saccharimonadales bacterium]